MPENVGFVIDGLPHGVDLMRWITGAEVKTAAGFSRTFIPDRQVEDTTAGILEFTNGAVCTVNTSAAAPGPYPGFYSHYSLIGTEGLLDMDPFGELHISNRKDGWRLVATQPKVGWESAETAFGDARMKAYRLQIQSFIDGIHGKPMTAGSGEDGRAGLAACLAMLTSTRERRLVELA
jgi:predicted dehydrogenase